jgi:hypothetical protein
MLTYFIDDKQWKTEKNNFYTFLYSVYHANCSTFQSNQEMHGKHVIILPSGDKEQ